MNIIAEDAYCIIMQCVCVHMCVCVYEIDMITKVDKT